MEDHGHMSGITFQCKEIKECLLFNVQRLRQPNESRLSYGLRSTWAILEYFLCQRKFSKLESASPFCQ